MKKVQKVMLAVGIIGVSTLIFIFGMYSVKYYMSQKHAKEVAAEIERREGIVESYSDVAYGNKSYDDVDLSGLTVEEITQELEKGSSLYSDRMVTISVDDDIYKYSMKKLGEKIYYKVSDGSRFQLGEEEKIAEIIVNMDKDKEMQEQYDIITGENEPAEYAVTVKCKYNKDKLNKFMDKLENNHVLDVVNAHIKKSGEITDAKQGKSLEIKKIKKKLKKYLNSESTKDYKAEYETTIVEPEWKKKDLKKVKTVISEFSTTFISSSSRGHNIIVGASRINGICLLPGESVSFDEVIHDESDGKKFQAAGSYLNGKVVQTEGGGICQVSTTAYNVLLRAGIIPTTRFPHSMPVHYVPLGLDAAISAGVKDLVVKNTLDVPVIIKAFTKGNTLTFQIVSYKGALNGYSYKPRSVLLSSLKAKACLDIYKNGKLKETRFLHTDTYRAAS